MRVNECMNSVTHQDASDHVAKHSVSLKIRIFREGDCAAS